MRLCTYRKGSSAPRLGAVLGEGADATVVDLVAAADAWPGRAAPSAAAGRFRRRCWS
jgi:hypothetical protein